MIPSADTADLQVGPSLDEVRALARDHTVVPLRHTFIDDVETPVSAYLKLRGDGPSFLLESAEQGQRVGRWSFLGVQPRTTMRLEHGVLTVGGETRPFDDPYAAVAAELERYKPAPLPDLPPFSGGAVGLFGYDLVRYAEPTVGDPNPDPVGVPDMALMVSDILVAFDHFKHETTILANVFTGPDSDVETAYANAVVAIADVRDRLAGPLPRAQAGVRDMPRFESNIGSDGYAAAVDRVKEYIRAGDAYQVVPSQRWSAEAPVEAFSIYRGLRNVNPSPYMYFLDFEDFEIAGASPESLVTVTGRRAAQRPIAGTRPRAATVEEDMRVAESLLADDKERAEHVMLVDLGRNDLGRVCEYGSVQVDELMVVETYSHVMHIVSSVSGTLRDGVTSMDALRASLPAGTLSGAPKVRAMQIIDELEPVSRGPYGGAIGWLSYSGDLDSCIYIRSAVVKDGRVHVQAGGGIVVDSEPDYEVRETEAKARAVMTAIELACRQGEWAGAEVLVIDNYDSFTYNVVQYLGELGAEPEVVRNDVATVDELLERAPDRVLVSPGPCTPTEAGVSVEVLRRFPEEGVPTLGVCLGHQALAAAWGGQVVRGEPIHGKTAQVEHDGRGVFRGLGSPITAGRYHSLIVHADLPGCLERSAWMGDTVMAIRHRDLPAEGVQFHPESVLTADGKALLRNFLDGAAPA